MSAICDLVRSSAGHRIHIVTGFSHSSRVGYLALEELRRAKPAGYLTQVETSSLVRINGDDLAHNLTDRDLVAFMPTDAHDATHRVSRSSLTEWDMSLLKEELL